MGYSELNQSLAGKANWAYEQRDLQEECPESSNHARNMAKINPKNHYEGKHGIIDISKICSETYEISNNLNDKELTWKIWQDRIQAFNLHFVFPGPGGNVLPKKNPEAID